MTTRDRPENDDGRFALQGDVRQETGSARERVRIVLQRSGLLYPSEDPWAVDQAANAIVQAILVDPDRPISAHWPR